MKEPKENEREACHNEQPKNLPHVMSTSFPVPNINLKTGIDQSQEIFRKLIDLFKYKKSLCMAFYKANCIKIVLLDEKLL